MVLCKIWKEQHKTLNMECVLHKPHPSSKKSQSPYCLPKMHSLSDSYNDEWADTGSLAVLVMKEDALRYWNHRLHLISAYGIKIVLNGHTLLDGLWSMLYSPVIMFTHVRLVTKHTSSCVLLLKRKWTRFTIMHWGNLWWDVFPGFGGHLFSRIFFISIIIIIIIWFLRLTKLWGKKKTGNISKHKLHC